MEIYARQGDLVINKAATMPDGLEKQRGLVLAGATSSPHTVVGTVEAKRDGGSTFIRVTEATTVEHAGRHKPVKLAPGDYVVRPLRERGGEGDRAVED